MTVDSSNHSSTAVMPLAARSTRGSQSSCSPTSSMPQSQPRAPAKNLMILFNDHPDADNGFLEQALTAIKRDPEQNKFIRIIDPNAKRADAIPDPARCREVLAAIQAYWDYLPKEVQKAANGVPLRVFIGGLLNSVRLKETIDNYNNRNVDPQESAKLRYMPETVIRLLSYCIPPRISQGDGTAPADKAHVYAFIDESGRPQMTGKLPIYLSDYRDQFQDSLDHNQLLAEENVAWLREHLGVAVGVDESFEIFLDEDALKTNNCPVNPNLLTHNQLFNRTPAEMDEWTSCQFSEAWGRQYGEDERARAEDLPGRMRGELEGIPEIARFLKHIRESETWVEGQERMRRLVRNSRKFYRTCYTRRKEGNAKWLARMKGQNLTADDLQNSESIVRKLDMGHLVKYIVAAERVVIVGGASLGWAPRLLRNFEDMGQSTAHLKKVVLILQAGLFNPACSLFPIQFNQLIDPEAAFQLMRNHYKKFRAVSVTTTDTGKKISFNIEIAQETKVLLRWWLGYHEHLCWSDPRSLVSKDHEAAEFPDPKTLPDYSAWLCHNVPGFASRKRVWLSQVEDEEFGVTPNSIKSISAEGWDPVSFPSLKFQFSRPNKAEDDDVGMWSYEVPGSYLIGPEVHPCVVEQATEFDWQNYDKFWDEFPDKARLRAFQTRLKEIQRVVGEEAEGGDKVKAKRQTLQYMLEQRS